MELLDILIISYLFIGFILLGAQAYHDKKTSRAEDDLSNGFKMLSIIFMPSALLGVTIVIFYYFIIESYKAFLSPIESFKKFAIWWNEKS